MMRAKTLAAGGALMLVFLLTGCGGSSVAGEYEGALQDPDGPEQIAVTLEIEERDDGTLVAQMGPPGEDDSARLTGPEPDGDRFELTSDSASFGEPDAVIDGQVEGDDLEADVIMRGQSVPLTAERQ